MLFCTFEPLERIVTDCVRSDTPPPKITTALTGAVFGSRDADASVTETRINWTRWKRVVNFKPLSCTSKKAPSSHPLHKVTADVVFSLRMKGVRIGFVFVRDCSWLKGCHGVKYELLCKVCATYRRWKIKKQTIFEINLHNTGYISMQVFCK